MEGNLLTITQKFSKIGLVVKNDNDEKDLGRKSQGTGGPGHRRLARGSCPSKPLSNPRRGAIYGALHCLQGSMNRAPTSRRGSPGRSGTL